MTYGDLLLGDLLIRTDIFLIVVGRTSYKPRYLNLGTCNVESWPHGGIGCMLITAYDVYRKGELIWRGNNENLQ